MRLVATVTKSLARRAAGDIFLVAAHGPGMQRALCAAPRFACLLARRPHKPAQPAQPSPAAAAARASPEPAQPSEPAQRASPANQPSCSQPTSPGQPASQPHRNQDPCTTPQRNQNSQQTHLLLAAATTAAPLRAPGDRHTTALLCAAHSHSHSPSSPARPNASRSATEPPTSQRGRITAWNSPPFRTVPFARLRHARAPIQNTRVRVCV